MTDIPPWQLPEPEQTFFNLKLDVRNWKQLAEIYESRAGETTIKPIDTLFP